MGHHRGLYDYTDLENEGKQVRPDIWVAGVPDIQIKRLGKKVEFQKK